MDSSFTYTRLYDFDPGEFYALVECPDCDGEGLVEVDPATNDGRDTGTCPCVRPAAQVPERTYVVEVKETSVSYARVRARAANEAAVLGEDAVMHGGGINEKFAGRDTLSVEIDGDAERKDAERAAADGADGNPAASEMQLDHSSRTSQAITDSADPSGLQVPTEDGRVAGEPN